MNILLVSNFYKPSWETGGVTKVNYELAKNLVRLGHNVTVYTTDGFNSRLNVRKNVPVDVEGVKVYYFYNLSRYFVQKLIFPIPYFAPLIIRKDIRNFDVIHIHEHRSLLAVFVHYYAKKYKVPYILQSHGSVFPHFQNKGLKKFFDLVFGDKILKDASQLIALTETEAKQYMQMGIDESKICIIPNGINLEEFENLPEKGEFRKKYSIKDSDKIILFLGRIDKIKGIDFLIDSFSQLRSELNNVKLVIVGPKVDEYYPLMIEKVKTLNLTDSVLFTGPLYGWEKKTAYVDSNILAYPSIFEIFGLVPFEAIMCVIRRVIVTDGCGCGEIVNEANCGNLVKYGDVSDLTKKIKAILESPELSSRFVENGKRYISNNLAWKNIILKIEGCYADCVRNF
jgi:glycosyltransferase involved in cell wall biosynthesis